MNDIAVNLSKSSNATLLNVTSFETTFKQDTPPDSPSSCFQEDVSLPIDLSFNKKKTISNYEIYQHFSALQNCEKKEMLAKLTSMCAETQAKNDENDFTTAYKVLGIPTKLFEEVGDEELAAKVAIYDETVQQCDLLLTKLQPVFNHSLVELSKSFSSYFNKFAQRVNGFSDGSSILNDQMCLSFQMHLMQAGVLHFTQFVDNRLALTSDLKNDIFSSIERHCEQANESDVYMCNKIESSPSIECISTIDKPKVPKRKFSSVDSVCMPAQKKKSSKTAKELPITEDIKSYDPTGIHHVTVNTLFIKGSELNRLLGYGETRGRIYTKFRNMFNYRIRDEEKDMIKNIHHLSQNGAKPRICFWTDYQRMVNEKLYNSKDFVYDSNTAKKFAFTLPDAMTSNIQTCLEAHIIERNMQTIPTN